MKKFATILSAIALVGFINLSSAKAQSTEVKSTTPTITTSGCNHPCNAEKSKCSSSNTTCKDNGTKCSTTEKANCSKSKSCKKGKSNCASTTTTKANCCATKSDVKNPVPQNK